MPSARLSAYVETEPDVALDLDVVHEPSDEQDAIYAWFADARGNLVVEALAGTGKTTTILAGIGFAPETDILLTAFTKRIQEELESRLTNPCAVAQTLHSVGFEAIRRNGWGYVTPSLRGFDREDRLSAMVTGGMPYGAKRLVAKLVTKARELCPLALRETEAAGVQQLCELAEDYDLTPGADHRNLYVEDVAEATLRAMRLAAQDEGSARETGIDGADMIFLPLVNDWFVPRYDLVVVDEYQDMTPPQLLVAQRVARPGARFALVGDVHQAIFQFRGANLQTCEQLKRELRAVTLPLTTTYRCPRKVVTLAQQYVPSYRAADEAPEGIVDTIESIEATVEQARPGDFVLSRKNAPLARVALALLRANKRARIQGRDIGSGLKTLIRRLSSGKAADSIPELLRKLRTWQEREVTRHAAQKRFDLCDLARDKAETLSTLAADSRGVPDLLDRIGHLFADKGIDQIVCSTVHKAKGLEADRVFVLKDTFGVAIQCACGHRHRAGQPCDKCRCRAYVPDETRKLEERNIKYVAITRARKRLTWVEEKL